MNSRNHHMWSSYSSYLVRSVGGLGQDHKSVGYKAIDFRPSKHYELRAANVSMELAHGTAALRWVRHGGYQFDYVNEGDITHLSCGRMGGRIVGVETASFGTPHRVRRMQDAAAEVVPRLRQDQEFERDTECHAEETEKVIARECVGKLACTLRATRETFEMAAVEQAKCTRAGSERPAGRWY